ncbi:outer membrane protein assembly factor BamA [bacterium]|jgi:outer membrane protein insertion porin family|nr:outer membrane protein assembly factor BamA [bacterium]MBT3795198.1 outer membrane protein assembly factor BamA [bacterium]
MRKILYFIIISFVFLTPLGPSRSESVNSVSFNSEQNISYEGSTLDKVEFYGNKIILLDKIQEVFSLKSGDVFKNEDLKEGIKALYGTNYFYRIDAVIKKIDKELVLIIRFEENPILASFTIKGNDEVSVKDLSEPLNLSIGKIISRRQLDISKKIVEQFYFYKGFNNVVVEDAIFPIGESKIEYVISIKEGKRGYVKGIDFIGVDEAFKKELLKSIETKVRWVWSPITGRGRLSLELVDMDEQNVKQFFLNKGFLDIRTDKPKVTYDEGKDGYRVVFKVSQGIRYRTKSIAIKGDLIEDEKVLKDSLQLKKDDFFSTGKLTEDIEKLNTIYGDKSYAFANISPNIMKDKSNDKVKIEFVIEKGEKFKVNLINISGNTRTRDKVIRRQVLVNENDDYSASKIKASKQRINRRGFFETVEISEVPVENKEKYLDLNVDVVEKATGFFSIAGGYSSSEKLLLGIQIQESNLFGYGKQLSTSATVGGLSKNFSVDYSDPYFLDTSYTFGFQVFNSEYQYVDFDRNSYGGKLRFGKAISNWSFINLRYRYESIRIDRLKLAASEVFEEGTDEISSLALGVTYDTRDNFVNPSKGISANFNVEESNEVFGADLYYTKYSSSFKKYYSIKRNHTLAYKIDGGFVDFREIGNRIIVGERYYLGGPNNLRGFKASRVSPRRLLSTGNFVRIGGNKYVFNTLEYLFPIALETGLRGILFVDAGNTYDETENIDYNPNDMKKDMGFGFRWLSPMGPLKLDFGFPLGKRKSGESKYEVQFSIGSLF